MIKIYPEHISQVIVVYFLLVHRHITPYWGKTFRELEVPQKEKMGDMKLLWGTSGVVALMVKDLKLLTKTVS
jgi:hypothetical protein